MDSLSTLALPEPTAEPVRFEVSPEVRRSLGALALAVNHGLEEEQLRVAAYALRDLSPSLLRAACLKLGQTERFWPKPIDIRETADAILVDEHARESAAKLLPMPKSEADEPRFFCLDCRDEPNAWRPLYCLGSGEQRAVKAPAHVDVPTHPCGRLKPHYPHNYAEKCGCSDTNPVIAEARRRMNASRVRREQRRAS